jgi:hypothetical protein
MKLFESLLDNIDNCIISKGSKMRTISLFCLSKLSNCTLNLGNQVCLLNRLKSGTSETLFFEKAVLLNMPGINAIGI